MISPEEKTLYVSGNEKIVMVRSLLDDEFMLDPMRYELSVIQTVKTLYKFPNQSVRFTPEVSVPGIIKRIEQIVHILGDKDRYRCGWDHLNEVNWGMILDYGSAKHTGVNMTPRYIPYT